MIKKHLIFHFFVPEDYETNIAIRMHYACLWKYHEIFDKAEFFISSTENSKKYVSLVKKSLINIFDCDDIRIKEIENDEFCEGRTLNDYVINRLGDFKDEIVFFGHTKGVTKVEGDDYERFLKWIFALYYFSFEFMEECEKKLIYAYMGRFRAFFGPMMSENGKYAIYPGTFYWLNPMEIKNDLDNGDIKIPKLSNRAFAEGFPSIYPYVITNGRADGKVDGHNGIVSNFYDFDFYHGNFDEIIAHYGDYETFMDEYNNSFRQIL